MSVLYVFFGGFCLLVNKECFIVLLIQQVLLVQCYIVLFGQYIGVLVWFCVEVGQVVFKGQIIVFLDGIVSVVLYVLILGIVVVIGVYFYLYVFGFFVLVIVIVSDGLECWIELYFCLDFCVESLLVLFECICVVGIGGFGGVGFFIVVKFVVCLVEKIYMLVVNGVECEFYISVDDLFMCECVMQVLGGIDILVQILCFEEVLVGIEDDKLEVIVVFSVVFGEWFYCIVVLLICYFLGGECQLIQLFIGREVFVDGLLVDIGILCQNVGILVVVYDVVVFGWLLILWIIIFVGGVLEWLMNVEVLIGMLVYELLVFVGFVEGCLECVLMGGLMMGFVLFDFLVLLIKICNCLFVGDVMELLELVLVMFCICCGDCVQVCFVSLLL